MNVVGVIVSIFSIAVATFLDNLPGSISNLVVFTNTQTLADKES